LFVLTFHRETVYAVEPLIVIFIVFGAAWILVLVVFDVESSINEAIVRVILYSVLVGYVVCVTGLACAKPCQAFGRLGNTGNTWRHRTTPPTTYPPVGGPIPRLAPS
jgi:hypothetical protein